MKEEEMDGYANERERLFVEALRRIPDPMQDFFYACVRTQAAKGADYTMGKDDRLANFREGAQLLGPPHTMLTVWAVYAWKHWTAVIKYCRTGFVDSEPIWKRCMDLAVYVSLLALMAMESNPKQAPTRIQDYKPEIDS